MNQNKHAIPTLPKCNALDEMSPTGWVVGYNMPGNFLNKPEHALGVEFPAARTVESNYNANDFLMILSDAH